MSKYDKLSGRRVQKKHVFYVPSLIDKNPEDYQAICCAMTGTIIGHKRKGDELEFPVQEVEEQKEEPKDLNQLNLF